MSASKVGNSRSWILSMALGKQLSSIRHCSSIDIRLHKKSGDFKLRDWMASLKLQFESLEFQNDFFIIISSPQDEKHALGFDASVCFHMDQSRMRP